jgi:hypothetical protein
MRCAFPPYACCPRYTSRTGFPAVRSGWTSATAERIFFPGLSGVNHGTASLSTLTRWHLIWDH